MKRGIILILCFSIFVCLQLTTAITVKSITGEAVTGRASTQPYNVSINVTAATAPQISSITATFITSSGATITWTTDKLSNSTVFYGTTIATTSFSAFPSLVTSHSIALTLLSSSTLYYYNVSSCDSAGLCNVSSQYNFTTSATPTPTLPIEIPAAGGGGGAGISVAPEATKFSIEPEIIKVVLKTGGIFKSSVKIKNTDTITQNFKIDTGVFKDFIAVDETEFTLQSGEEKEISLIFYALENMKEGTYTGKIKIYGTAGYKELSIIFSVKSKLLLFDVTLSIPTKYKEVKPGEEILLQIILFNLGEEERADVQINYYIKDFDGNTIIEKESVVGVETQASFSTTLKIPENASDGQYVAGVNVRYDDSIGTASDIFYISRKKKFLFFPLKIEIIPILITVIILIIVVIFVLEHYAKKFKGLVKIHAENLDKIEKRIKQGNLKMVEATKLRNKLNTQLALINKAYEKGYIKKDAYEKSRERISNAGRILKKKYL